MSNKTSNWLVFLVAVLVILQIITLTRVSNLRNQVNSLQNQVSNSINDTCTALDNFSNSIEQQLAAEASIIDSYAYKFDDFNEDDLTITLNFTVVPKEVATDTTAFLEIDGVSFPMQRQGDSFVATTDMELFQDINQPRVILESNDLRQQETIYLSLVPRYEALPQLCAWLEQDGGSTTHQMGVDGHSTYYLNGAVQVNTADKTSGGKAPFQNLRLIVQVDGETVFQRDTDEFPQSDFESSSGCYLQIPENIEIPLAPNQKLRVLVQGEDEYGLTHQTVVDTIDTNATGEPDWNAEGWPMGEETLLDRQGNILWPSESY